MLRLIRAFFYENGRFSVTRFWKNAAYAVATVIVWKMGADVSWEVLALYLTIIAADNRAGALLRAKFGAAEEAPTSVSGSDRQRPPASRRPEAP